MLIKGYRTSLLTSLLDYYMNTSVSLLASSINVYNEAGGQHAIQL